MPGGIGILPGDACARQRVVALDLQPATVEHGVMAQVGVEADVPARRRVPVTHRLRRGMSHQLVETWNGNQFIPVHPIDTPNLLVTRAAGPSAQQKVMLSSVEASPGVGAGPVDELPILARLNTLQPDRMNPGGAHRS